MRVWVAICAWAALATSSWATDPDTLYVPSPSQGASAVWTPPHLQGGAAAEIMERAHTAARDYFRNAVGVELEAPYHILGGDDAAIIAAETMRRQPMTRAYLSRHDLPCGTPDNPRAAALGNMAVLCWASPAVYDATWRTARQTRWSAHVVHEYTHLLQFESSGAGTRDRLPSSERTLGPRWLVEGTAEVFEEAFYATQPGYRARPIGARTRRVRGHSVNLRDLHDTVSDKPAYDLAQFAAHLLIERYGSRTVFEYFRALPQAESWSDAFEATFGLSLAEYELEFAKMRENLVLSYRFAAGEE